MMIPDKTFPEKIDEKTKLAEQLASLIKENQSLKDQLGHERARSHEFGMLFTSVVNSKSWKITEPLRGLFSTINFFKRYARQKEIVATHYRNHYDAGQISGKFFKFNQDIREPWFFELIGAREMGLANRLAYYSSNELVFSFNDRTVVKNNSGKYILKLSPQAKYFCIECDQVPEKINLRPISVFEFIGLVKDDVISRSSSFKRVVQLFTKGIRELTKGTAGINNLLDKLRVNHDFHLEYEAWIEQYDTLSNEDLAKLRIEGERLPYQPSFSIIVPVFNPEPFMLAEAVLSVANQSYENWELILIDDCSTDDGVRRILEELALGKIAKDSPLKDLPVSALAKIKVIYRKENGHIAKASNDGIKAASGDYIALLDHDDTLSLNALYENALALNERPYKYLYSDEDKLNQHGNRFNPYFKTAWNPILMLSQNYCCHFSVMERALVQSIGGFDSRKNGAQDWDLILRATDACRYEDIRHIPKILYHWRLSDRSTAQSTAAKPYVLEAQKQTVLDHLKRCQLSDYRVEIDQSIHNLKVDLQAKSQLVSLIIPTKNGYDILKQCVESILNATAYPNYEIIIADNGSDERKTVQYLNEISKNDRVTVLPCHMPFNYSKINNLAARSAKGSILGFINNDIEVINPWWLNEMVQFLYFKETVAVGAKLLYPNGLLQHCGVSLGVGGVAGHTLKGRRSTDPGYFNRLILPHNVSAVTAACMVVDRIAFEQVGGFDETNLQVAFNDIDLCLKLGEQGGKIVVNPRALLYHHESYSRGYEDSEEKIERFRKEIRYMQSRWANILPNDPNINPNFSLLTEDFCLSFPPRTREYLIGHEEEKVNKRLSA